MTATYIPNAVIPAGAPTIPLTELVAASAPLGGVAAFLDSLTGSYGPIDRGVIRSAYNRLQAAGVLPVMDTFAFKLGNAADSLRNWTGGANAENFGGTFGAKGFVLDGVDDFIRPNFLQDGSGNYKLNFAHLGGYISAVPDPDDTTKTLIGRDGGAIATVLAPRSGSSGANWRINSNENLFLVHDKPITGLWHMGRRASGNVPLFHGLENLADPVLSTGAYPVDLLAIGRSSSTGFHDMTVCSWFSGGYLLTEPRNVLVDVCEMLRAHFVGTI